MGRLKELQLRRDDARPVAFKLLMETRFDLEAARKLARERLRDGMIDADAQTLVAMLDEAHAEGEPLRGVAVIIPEQRKKDIA